MTMKNPFYLLLFSSLLFANDIANGDDKERRVYIVYLGEKPHDDLQRLVESHHDLLAGVVGSKEQAKKLLLYNYKHSFSGFAAQLTKDEAGKLAGVPGVYQVTADTHHKRHNTRTWASLGLSHWGSPNNLLHQANMGDGIIIGIVDSGIWPDSEAFNDYGLGPIPARWKGECQPSGKFTSKHCNRKIIGARYYVKGYMAGDQFTVDDFKDTPEGVPSVIDVGGHGTHVASTAAGSFVYNVSYFNIKMGTFRGGAPRARLAIYKACWNAPSEACTSSDILAAIDDAVRDGVDVLSVSLGGSFPHLPEVSPSNALAIGSFHAVIHGIPVISSAGNDGPTTSSVEEVAPWMISVAASTVDRAFPTPITLGNNKTIMGRGMIMGKKVGLTKLVEKEFPLSEDSDLTSAANVTGNVILSFFKDFRGDYYLRSIEEIIVLGAAAMIVVKPEDDNDLVSYSDRMKYPKVLIPVVEIDFEAGNELLEYMERCSTGAPTVELGPSSMFVGKPLSPRIAGFSSRGPNALAPEILKPDIAAPGVSILGAVPPDYPENDNGFGFMSGTSMAAPHIGGIIALLRTVRPKWSPAALRSALVTTAWNQESFNSSIFADASPIKIADPFDYGGGLVNPNAVANPGLVYDMDKEHYMRYLCSQHYRLNDIYKATKETGSNDTMDQRSICKNRDTSLMELNLPSITITYLHQSMTVRRRVTNVGPTNSVYRARIRAPRGTKMTVHPDVLEFNENQSEMGFAVTVTAKQNFNTGGYVFGSLIWTDGKHYVTIPVSVRTTLYTMH